MCDVNLIDFLLRLLSPLIGGSLAVDFLYSVGNN